MRHLTTRQSTNDNILNILKAIIDCKMVLTPVIKKQTLNDLLAGSPKNKLRFTPEDNEWINE